MLYKYQTVSLEGKKEEGSIDASSVDIAIASLHKRGLTVSEIHPIEEKKKFGVFNSFFNRVTNKDVVILSRQLSTLFDAQVSALRVFKLLAGEIENPTLRSALTEVTDDLQGGAPISKALSKHPKIFSDFYVSMVKAGEETGKLDDTFTYLADHLDRTYEVTSKARNAFIYPVFVITVFIGVMVMMFTLIIPKISVIIKDSGQTIPIFTKVIFAASEFFLNYGVFIAALLVVGGFFFAKFLRTKEGRIALDTARISYPYIGDLYKKMYLSIISDNMHTMVSSGIPMLKAIEITQNVIDNAVYKDILGAAALEVKAGSPLSAALSKYREIPSILIQMIRVGEETGELGNILNTMAKFYEREVRNAVDVLVSLIEPVMIVFLGLGVGLLMAAVLLPIYNMASGTGF